MRRFLLAILLALTPALALSSPASAATIVQTISYRECTNTSLAGCALRGQIPGGAAVTMHCWIDDSTATGRYTSNRWFYVTAPGAVRGFVHSSWVDNQTANTPNCSTHRGIAVSRWAAMRVGNTKPTTAEKIGNSFTYWSSWCYVFAAAAHKLGYNNTPLTGYGTAKATYNEYKRRGLVSTNMDQTKISIGSIVFFEYGTAGHAAIYAGNGYVITTQGSSESEKLPIARKALSSWSQPLGWVAPSNV